MVENNRFLESRHPIFIDSIDWQDGTFGIAEGTEEYSTEGNYTINITYKLTLETGLDGRTAENLEIEELFVENVYGKEVDLTEDEYYNVVENFRNNLVWEL